MKNPVQLINFYTGKLNSNHVRLFWLVLTTLLFAVGAGAPEGDTGWGGG